MEVNSVITLEDGLVCELLDKVELENNTYLLAESLMDDKPTGKYAILKETEENKEYFVEKVTDEHLLLEILTLFTEKLAKLIGKIDVNDLLD